MDNNAILVHASVYFQDEPRKWAEELAALGRNAGYDYIQPTVEMLEDCHPDNKEVMGLLTMLRQPEWEWRSCANDDRIRFFGIPVDGEYVARGFYVTGRHETGEVKVLHQFDETAEYVVGDEIVDDPRDAYEARALKVKVWRRKPRKYVLAMTGRVVDLVKYGFSLNEIKLTGGKGYFHRYPAFAIYDGPWKDKAEAIAAKRCLQ